MSPGQIRGAYVLYIGAGAVAAGGIISLMRSLPLIWRGLRSGLRDFQSARKANTSTGLLRTDQDFSVRVVLYGPLALLGAIGPARPLHMNGLAGVVIVVVLFL